MYVVPVPLVVSLLAFLLLLVSQAARPEQTAPQPPGNASPERPANQSPPAPVNASPQAPVNASPQAPSNASPQAPGNASPQAPGNATPTSPDPAAAFFAPTSSAGLLLVTVKADKTSDYEDAIRALQEALSKSIDEQKRAIAKGWRVFKSDNADPKANAIYIHLIDPTVAGVDYRPSLLLDELLAGASAELLGKYRDAIVSGPTKLGMNELANMAVAPLPKPTNASPDAPVGPKKPGM